MRQRSGANLLSDENNYYRIDELYELDSGAGGVLGTGVSGKVILAWERKSRVRYAVKFLKKRKLRADKLKQLQEEVRIMSDLSHPNILRIFDAFESREDIHLVLELLQGGELLDRLHSQPNSQFSEPVARRYVHTMLATIRYLHSKGIVHRDLKLENFLFETISDDSDLKLIDFGLSHRCSSTDEVLTKSCGTPYYVSPEVLEGAYTCKCDIWSLGVITFMLLSGTPPFNGSTDTATLKAVKAGRFQLNTVYWQSVSSAAKSFIRSCLVRGEGKRPSAEQLMLHHWFSSDEDGGGGGGGSSSSSGSGRGIANGRGGGGAGAGEGEGDSSPLPIGCLVSNPLDSQTAAHTTREFVDRMLKFGSRSGLSKLFLGVIARTLTPEQIISQRIEWNKIDKHRRGVLLLQDLKDSLLELGTDASQQQDDPGLARIFVHTDGTILFHEFLAGTMQTVDESNLRLAFDKISLGISVITSDALATWLGADANTVDVEELVSEAGLQGKQQIDFEAFTAIVNQSISSPAPLQSPYNKFRKRVLSGEHPPAP